MNVHYFRNIFLKTAVNASVSCTVLLLFTLSAVGNTTGDWPYYGGNLESTNSANDPGVISVGSVKTRGFRLIWSQKFDPNFNGDNDDDVQPGFEPGLAKKPGSHTPSIVGNRLYYTALGKQQVEFAPGLFREEEVGDVGVINITTGEFVSGFPIDISTYSDAVSTLVGRDIRLRASRNTPILHNGKLIFGTRLAGASSDEYFAGTVNGLILSIDANDGSLDETGATIGEWATIGDEHPYTRITVSPVEYDGLIYSGAAIPDYAAVFNPTFPVCCNSRGSVFALDPRDGSVIWKTYMVPAADGEEDLDGPIGSINGINLRQVDNPNTLEDESWYSGGSVWAGAPVIDKKRGLVIVGTGNNGAAPREAKLCEIQRRFNQDQERAQPLGFPDLTLDEKHELAVRLDDIRDQIGAAEVVCDAPPVVLTDANSAQGKTVSLNDAFLSTINYRGHRSYGNYPDAIVALDIKTGEVRWAHRTLEYDAYNIGCDFRAPTICNIPFGVDADIAGPPILLTLKTQKCTTVGCYTQEDDVVLGTSKGGLVFALNADDGTPYEPFGGTKKLAQLGLLGGHQFGATTDGERLYIQATHSGNIDTLNVNGVESAHKLCFGTELDDERTAVLMPPIRVEVNEAEPLPGCVNVTPELTSTVGSYISAIDIKSGQVLWQYADPSGAPEIDTGIRSYRAGGLSTVRNVLVAGSTLGIIRFHNGGSGKVIREIDLNQLNSGEFAHAVDSAPAIVGNRIYLATGLSSTVQGALPLGHPFFFSDNVRLLAFELCPAGTEADPQDITRCVEKSEK